MKIAFHGAAQTVTGSKYVITLKNGKKLLLDCGMFQGMGKDTDRLNRSFGFNPREINYMILSHAHIDHSGLIPKLVKDGFEGKIYCTPATKDLAEVLLADSARIQEADITYINKQKLANGKEPLEPLYTEEDAAAAMKNFISVDYHTKTTIDDDIEFEFTDAGHIIGSACVHIDIKENGTTKKITFSGDVGRYRDLILKSPETFRQADVIIIESTYGNSLHEDFNPTPDCLLEWINKTCLEKKGKLIIPAFSVGRTQEILYALNQLENEGRLPKIPYYVDSPLSVDATRIIKSYPNYFNSRISKLLESDSDPFGFVGLSFIKSREESKLLNFKKEPCVIISASGMAEAGRVKHHIANSISNRRNTILLTGYCEPNSLGGRLKKRPEEVSIFGQHHTVLAEIAEMRSMSAHGDYEDLFQFLACQNPQEVEKLFLVHGEYDVQYDFKQKLLKKGFKDIEIPAQHYELGI